MFIYAKIQHDKHIRDSPADKAELEKDDIIIGFQGQDVNDQEKFVSAVQKAGVGTEVSMEIIHLGKRKTVKLKLEPMKEEPQWKYPPEPDIVQSWHPGKIFHLKPGEKSWIEVFPLDKLKDIEIDIDTFIKELHTYHHSEGDETIEVTIAGNPNDENTEIIVRIGDKEHKTIVKEIDKLPEKYQEIVKEDLERARKSYKQRRRDIRFPLPSPPDPEVWRHQMEVWKHYPQAWRHYFENIPPQPHPPAPPSDPDERLFDRIEKQLRQLQERLEELEKHQKELLERLSDKIKKEKLQEQKEQQMLLRHESKELTKI